MSCIKRTPVRRLSPSPPDLRSISASLVTIIKNQRIIMSKISDFANAQNAHNTRMDSAVAGITADVAELNRQIVALQNTPPELTPEDQELLDGIQARSEAIANKLDALDALTPPAVPPAV